MGNRTSGEESAHKKIIGIKGKKPLYRVLRTELLNQYKGLSYYAPFPSERDISEQYQISRPTVRMALELLEKEGKVVRLPGKGTFFTGNRPYVDHQLAFAKGFYHDAQLQGHTTKSKVLFQNIEKATAEVALHMGIEEGDTIFRLERLRYLDGEIYSLTNSYLPLEHLKFLLETDFTDTSLYDVLSAHGITPAKGHQCLLFEPAGSYEAAVLGIGKGEPLSVMSSQMYAEDGRLIEYVRVQTQAYRVRFEMTVGNDGDMNLIR
ncbi:MAG: GntR family transcriptional regulator [Christensenella sp.]|uniref:GntR family transcriptional regulator n=1 Tax=Christensenella sp. TaxID=1935934 RepID=UPI002B205306|nr:GntR family transcriptional regulator [Christensenella sp.]MEA5002863.1 GntR family transcriptional regulator [Christensenella sp.]